MEGRIGGERERESEDEGEGKGGLEGKRENGEAREEELENKKRGGSG